MDNEIKILIKKCVIRDVQIKLLEQEEMGQIINKDIINKILDDLEDTYTTNQ